MSRADSHLPAALSTVLDHWQVVTDAPVFRYFRNSPRLAVSGIITDAPPQDPTIERLQAAEVTIISAR